MYSLSTPPVVVVVVVPRAHTYVRTDFVRRPHVVDCVGCGWHILRFVQLLRAQEFQASQKSSAVLQRHSVM